MDVPVLSEVDVCVYCGGEKEMSECWGELFYPDWYEHFRRIWGEFEIDTREEW